MTEQKEINAKASIQDDEIDLKELLSVIWHGKDLILRISVSVAIISIIVSIFLTNYYQSESLLAIREDRQSESILSQYSGVASLVGINLTGSGDNRAIKAIELIKSRKFVSHLLTFEDILPSIMAPYSFEKETGVLTFDKSIFDSNNKKWIRKQNGNHPVEPSYLEAHEVYLNNIMSISYDNLTGFISISVEHISPIFARDFLELIIREANTLLRESDIEESSQALKFLKSELSKTPLVVIQESINTLIEAQLEVQMLAQINEDYVLVKIEPPFIPEEISKPSRFLIIALSTIMGLMLSILIVLFQYYMMPSTSVSQDDKQ